MNVYLLILVLFWALYGFQIFAFWGIGDNKQSFFFLEWLALVLEHILF